MRRCGKKYFSLSFFSHSVSNVKLATLIVEPLATLIVLNGPLRPQYIFYTETSALTNSCTLLPLLVSLTVCTFPQNQPLPHFRSLCYWPMSRISQICAHSLQCLSVSTIHCPSVVFQFPCTRSIMLCRHAHNFFLYLSIFLCPH